MKKQHTLKKMIVTTTTLGAAMHFVNQYMIKKATAKNLLKKEQGNFYSFEYGDIFYKKTGKGTPIFLIHDLNECSSSMEWFYLEQKLAKTNTVYTIDLLGCGRSAKPKLVYTNFLYVRLISSFINDIIQEKTDIIATGKSAAPVIMSAKLNNHLINRLILINPSDLIDFKEIPDRISKLKKGLITCPILGTFIYHMSHRADNIINCFLDEYYSNPHGDFQELSEYYYESCHKDRSGSKYLYASLKGNYLNIDITHGLKKLDQKILIISGEDFYESEFVPKSYGKFNKNIACVSILNTSYLPQLEAPGKVIDLIHEYWAIKPSSL